MAEKDGPNKPSLLYRLGHLIARRRLFFLVGYLAVVVAIVALSKAIGGEYVSDFSVPGSSSANAQNVVDTQFPTKSGATAQLVFEVTTGKVGAQKQAIEATLRHAESLEHVQAVGDPFRTVSIDDALTKASGSVSGDDKVAVASVQYDEPSSALGLPDLEALQELATESSTDTLKAYVGGALPISISEGPGETAEIIGLVAAVIILLFVFGSLVSAFIPLLHAGLGLMAGLSLITIMAGLTSVSSTATSLSTMVGMGVGIDYGLLTVNRFRDELRAGHPIPTAVGITVSTAGTSIAFAGSTVVVAIAGLAVAGIPAIQVMGAAAAMTVAIMAGASLVFLPSLLGLVGKGVNRINWRQAKEGLEAPRTPAGDLTAVAVKKPWLTILIGVGVLVALSSPLSDIRLAMPSGKTATPGSSQLLAYNAVRDHLSAGANGPLNVVLRLADPAEADSEALKDLNFLVKKGEKITGNEPKGDAAEGIKQQREYFKNAASDPRLVHLQRKIQKTHNIVSVSPGLVAEDPHYVLMAVTPISGPASIGTGELIEKLRNKVPKALSKDDAAYVGGSTALSVDFAATTGQRMPILILTVLVLAFLLLMIAFRSVLVPLKAALLTLLPVGAGMGVLVLVFQEGVGAETLGISASTPIFAYVPMLLFAIVFGLSIDYEVFLMSRVKEAEEHSELEPKEAVVTGIQSIARVVVAAATIMTAVFIAFFIQPDINVKMLALGLATAIVCEALIIAFAVSPAVMVLLGRHAWSLPPWLDRILPNIDVEGSAPETEAEPVTPQSG